MRCQVLDESSCYALATVVFVDRKPDHPERVAITQVLHGSDNLAGVYRDQARALLLRPRSGGRALPGRFVELSEEVGHVRTYDIDAVCVISGRVADFEHGQTRADPLGNLSARDDHFVGPGGFSLEPGGLDDEVVVVARALNESVDFAGLYQDG